MPKGNIKWISSTPEKQWETLDTKVTGESGDTLEVTGARYQKAAGFGGCFNELGWIALSQLDEVERSKALNALFDMKEGCKFTICRLPIGASDYGAQWYSHNETDGDYEMKHFNIERDYKYLIPYIKEAQKRNPDMKFFASPWSPPTWMKFPKVYNYGKLVSDNKNLEAYALYFKKFVEAYAAEGIEINQLHIQNEPSADQKFPSCLWTGKELRDFIKGHLGPLFEKSGMSAELWLGTINHGNYNEYANIVLSDTEARKYVKGVGYQWDGKRALQRTYESWPEVRLMQTENECGDGKNSWDYAKYVFTLFREYFNSGVEAYIYWNMVLEPKGRSTWGWEQNSMITADPQTKKVIYNPEFYVMKHFSHYVQPGAVRLGLKGHWTGNSIAFENPDGSRVYIVANPLEEIRELTVKDGVNTLSFELRANSFNTMVIK